MRARKQWEIVPSLQETEKGQDERNLRKTWGNELDRDGTFTAVTEKGKNQKDDGLQEKLCCRVLSLLFIDAASSHVL